VFNFFSEIKKELKLPDIDGGYDLVNINGKAVYIEGHKGLISISSETIQFKVKDKIIIVSGKDLKLKILSSVTSSIAGEIENISVK
jgi:sporulation protein YqfC